MTYGRKLALKVVAILVPLEGLGDGSQDMHIQALPTLRCSAP